MENNIILQAISALLAFGITNAYAEQQMTMHPDAPPGLEKCYGVAKKGMNDCGTNAHGCSGEAKIDRDSNSWLLVPTGLCKRISGGTTAPPTKQT